jgi:hypothetical protein
MNPQRQEYLTDTRETQTRIASNISLRERDTDDDIESDPDVVRSYEETKAGKGDRVRWEDVRDEID